MAEAPSWRWFGVPAVTGADGSRTLLRPERPHHLLAFLASRRGWVARDELATLFWPDRTQADARRNLRKVLLLAERLAGETPIERQGERLRWEPDSDLSRLDAASAAGRHEEVLDLYRPRLMEGLDAGLPPGSTDWLAFERARVEALWRRAATARLAQLTDAPVKALTLAETVLAHDPLDEEALLALVAAAEALGRPQVALAALQAHRLRLREEFDLEPPARLRSVADRLGEAAFGGTSARVVAKPAAQVDQPGSVAFASTAPAGFVGRRLELAQLQALLDEPACRAVTITGPGGIGKSSLARAALATLAKRFDGRAWWIGLADLASVDEVPERVARAAGIDLRGDTDAWSQIEAALGERPAALVFDNAEHLKDFAAVAAARLAALPAMKLVLTSRARLTIAGEWLLPMPGLPLPDADERDVEVLRHNDAVRLFEARALASSPAFDLAAQAEGVVDLLYRLEGLPLAIELAAAGVRLLPAHEIADEIERSLDLLEIGASGGAPVRDRSLRSSFAGSWYLLSSAEQGALGRLAQLPGPFDRLMAREVADAALPVIAVLVDKSLVRADGGGRFSIHPLLRQCAIEHAADSVDKDALARRHASHVTRWLEPLADARRHATPAMLAAVDLELPHLRAAWRHAVEHREPSLVERAAPVLLRFYEARGAWKEGLDLMTGAVAAFADAQPAERPGLLAALLTQAQLLVRLGRFAEGEQAAMLALPLAEALEDRAGIRSSVNLTGMSAYRQGRSVAARDAFARALELAREEGDMARLPALCSNLAVAESALGRYAEAQALYLESAVLARASGNAPSLAAALNNQATVQIALGDWRGAIASAGEALSIYRAGDLRSRRPLALLNLAEAQHQLGALAEAERSLDEALPAARESGEPDTLIEALLCASRVAADLATPRSLATARERLAEVLTLVGGGTVEQRLKAVLGNARILLREGDSNRGLALGRWATAHAECDPVQAAAWRRVAADAGPHGAYAADDFVLEDLIDDIGRVLAAARPLRNVYETRRS